MDVEGTIMTRLALQRNGETLLAVVQRKKIYLFMAPHNQHTFGELAAVICCLDAIETERYLLLLVP